jgi:hypothetical protein
MPLSRGQQVWLVDVGRDRESLWQGPEIVCQRQFPLILVDFLTECSYYVPAA